MEQQGDISGFAMAAIFMIMTPLYVAIIWACVRIVQKAGYSGWNFIWYFVPIVNVVMFFIFAFADWPVTKRVRELELQVFGPASTSAVDRPA